MDNRTKSLLPNWVNEKNNEKLNLVLSDDIDSLVSCSALFYAKKWEVKYFYDFKNVYKSTENIDMSIDKRCWVDVAIEKEKAFDNHVTSLSIEDERNPQSVNLNNMYWVTRDNYTDKYCGSTALEIWSLYDLPLPKTEKGMMILLAIDVAFKGFYDDNYHDRQKFYLVDCLGFNELYEVIQRHTKEEFYDVIVEFGLNAKIKLKNGKLETRLPLARISKELGIDVRLPGIEFNRIAELTYKSSSVESRTSFKKEIEQEQIISFAMTRKRFANYSTLKIRRTKL